MAEGGLLGQNLDLGAHPPAQRGGPLVQVDEHGVDDVAADGIGLGSDAHDTSRHLDGERLDEDGRRLADRHQRDIALAQVGRLDL